MTNNQIAYWNYVENARHNQAMEAEANRANRAQEREQQRSHRASEVIARQGNSINASFNEARAEETRRHNYATEIASVESLANERARTELGYYSSNMGVESAKINAGVGYANVALGYANLGELNRSHRMQEGIAARGVLTQEKNANTNYLNASTNAANYVLNRQKWEHGGAANILMSTAKMNQDIVQSKATIRRMASQNLTDKINAGSNLVGVVGRLTKKGK